MVCALSEGQLYKFNLRSRDLGMKSTARFIGVLEQTWLKQENVLFANLELRIARLGCRKRLSISTRRCSWGFGN